MVDLSRILRTFRVKFANIICRCIIDSVDDTKKMQLVKILLPGGGVKNVERAQQYGFWSNPPKGAEGVVVFVDGDQSHGIVLAVDDRRYNIKGKEKGEVVIGTDEGDKIHFKRGNKIVIESSNIVELKAPEVKIDGETKITGAFSQTGDAKLGGIVGTKKLVTEDILAVLTAHTHPYPITDPTPTKYTGLPIFTPPLAPAIFCTDKTEAK